MNLLTVGHWPQMMETWERGRQTFRLSVGLAEGQGESVSVVISQIPIARSTSGKKTPSFSAIGLVVCRRHPGMVWEGPLTFWLAH